MTNFTWNIQKLQMETKTKKHEKNNVDEDHYNTDNTIIKWLASKQQICNTLCDTDLEKWISDSATIKFKFIAQNTLQTVKFDKLASLKNIHKLIYSVKK